MNKPVLILGASSGIGEYCAKDFSSKGRTVVLVARRLEKLEQLKASLPSEAYCYQCDLDDLAAIKGIFDFCKDNEIKLDAMVYCAGMDASIPIKAYTFETMEKVMRVNCLAFFEAAKHFSNRKYSNEFSKIVAISSSASISCDKGMGLYSASKAALNAAVKTMSKEFVRRGILVNAILPTGVLTPMAAQKMAVFDNIVIDDVDRAIEEINNNPISINPDDEQPYGIITPDKIAALVGFLISDDNRYITGALIPVSAGRE